MIRLSRSPCPPFLTDAKVAELVGEFMASKASVWNVDQIKGPLLASSHGKCAYCECVLVEESKYMEVEHFQYKALYPEKVVFWFNLLPACKRCNGAKGGHDVLLEPIVNPYDENPADHLGMRDYRLVGLTERGASTVDVVCLNDKERLVLKRFLVGDKIAESISDAEERYRTFCDKQTTKSKNRLVCMIETILIECQPSANYAATTATSALTNSDFIKVISGKEHTTARRIRAPCCVASRLCGSPHGTRRALHCIPSAPRSRYILSRNSPKLIGKMRADGLWTGDLEILLQKSSPLVLRRI